MKTWNTIKYFLGMQCIAKFGNKYVVTKREWGLIRVCLARDEEFWWTHGFWNKHCSFDTLEQAEYRASVVISPSKPAILKLEPVP